MSMTRYSRHLSRRTRIFTCVIILPLIYYTSLYPRKTNGENKSFSKTGKFRRENSLYDKKPELEATDKLLHEEELLFCPTLQVPVVKLYPWRDNDSRCHVVQRDVPRTIKDITMNYEMSLYDPLSRLRNIVSGISQNLSMTDRVNSICDKLRSGKQVPITPEFVGQNMVLLRHFIVNRELKVLFRCLLKAGSKVWKKVMYNATSSKNLTYLEELSTEDIAHALNTYKKYMVVRDPLERVLSFYLGNHIMMNTKVLDGYVFDMWHDMLLKSTNKTSTYIHGHDIPLRSHLPFSKFVSTWISEDGMRNGWSSEHWMRAVDVTHPCLVKYDYIGQFGNIQDSKHIVESMGINTSTQFENKSQTKSWMVHFFAKLSPAERTRLEELYEIDKLMFGYK